MFLGIGSSVDESSIWYLLKDTNDSFASIKWNSNSSSLSTSTSASSNNLNDSSDANRRCISISLYKTNIHCYLESNKMNNLSNSKK